MIPTRPRPYALPLVDDKATSERVVSLFVLGVAVVTERFADCMFKELCCGNFFYELTYFGEYIEFHVH